MTRLTLRGFLAFPFLAVSFVLIAGAVVLALPFVFAYIVVGGDEA